LIFDGWHEMTDSVTTQAPEHTAMLAAANEMIANLQTACRRAVGSAPLWAS
jgi:hypothetical protein